MYSDLTGDVGHFLGYGRGEDNGDVAWDDRQQANVDRCVKGGLRKFYHCGHDWSFLKPTATLTLASGSSLVTLPDDCGGIEGRIAVSISGGSSVCVALSVGSVGQVYEQEARYPETTGQPQFCCVEATKGTTQQKGQNQRLHVWPEADQAYTLKFAYYVNPDYLSGSFPYAYGGPQHAETLLESCLAVAEKILDDKADVHAMEFKECLQSSIDIDRRLKPQTLGYNGDRSDDLHWNGWRQGLRHDQTILIAGVDPDA